VLALRNVKVAAISGAKVKSKFSKETVIWKQSADEAENSLWSDVNDTQIIGKEYW
jgi:hypothetical protein